MTMQRNLALGTVIAILVVSLLQSSSVLYGTTIQNVSNNRDALSTEKPIPIPFLLPRNESRPLSHLARNEDCTYHPNQPLQKVPGLFALYANNISVNLSSTTQQSLVCEFQTNQPFSRHFAHAMQQLYTCYSYFQSHSGIRILSVPNKVKQQFHSNSFLKGFLQFLQIQMKVSIQDPTIIRQNGDDNHFIRTTYFPGGYILSHVKELNEMMKLFLQNTTSSYPPSNQPRIGILNRRPSFGRSIQNVGHLVERLSNSSMHAQVSVEYFEGQSFADQVHFFQSTDILLSPHGAQLTGLPFLARCGQVLELFPANYIIPAFYGSLARNSNLAYSYLYLSDQGSSHHSSSSDSTLEHRSQARATNLCPSPIVIQDAVESLIQDWKDCQRHQS